MILKVTFDDIFKDSFLNNFSANVSITTIAVTLIYAFLLSLFVFFIYKLTTKGVIYSKKFNISMSLMSIITAAIVLSMQANITVSLGMVGALSIVRFRTAIKEPRDLLFLFWSISNGIIIGAGVYSMAIVLAIILAIAMLFFDIIPEKKTPYILVIYFKNVTTRDIEIILNSYKIKYKLKSENLSSKESSYIYELKVKKDKEFVNEILKIKGVSEVNLMSQDGESQY
ncbi:MAG: DUF4956 domain-containing protein [Bacilli bacterium]|nr:DUF4956 domain-containing protein [Bacilli bacterium]